MFYVTGVVTVGLTASWIYALLVTTNCTKLISGCILDTVFVGLHYCTSKCSDLYMYSVKLKFTHNNKRQVYHHSNRLIISITVTYICIAQIHF